MTSPLNGDEFEDEFEDVDLVLDFRDNGSAPPPASSLQTRTKIGQLDMRDCRPRFPTL
jgi:hypothetical protein